MYVKSLVRPDDTLLQIKIVAGVQLKELVLDPKGGRLQIICNGGTGGQGGTGGNGSDGLAETEKAGAGSGGNGGEGGRVTIYTDSLAAPLIENIFEIQNTGGKGGSGGRKGRAGYRATDNPWAAVGDLVGLRSGSRGNEGQLGQDGEPGLDPETVILTEARLNKALEE